MSAPDVSDAAFSVRPQMTSELMAQTGLDEDILKTLVHRFYDKVRQDRLLGPIFDERIDEWGPHLERMVAFWSSVALMSGRYHGRPVPAHTPLPVEGQHFERWLALFRETAHEVCTPAGAAHVIERAERIAQSLKIAVAQAQAGPNAVPSLF